jgi:hypothetical protein
MRLPTRYERWLQLHRLEAWLAAQPEWKVELMALGLALVIAGCFFGIWELGRWLFKAFVSDCEP